MVVLTVGRDIGGMLVTTHVTLLGDFSPLLVPDGTLLLDEDSSLLGTELPFIRTAVLLMAFGLDGRGVVVVVEDVRIILTAAGTATGRCRNNKLLGVGRDGDDANTGENSIGGLLRFSRV